METINLSAYYDKISSIRAKILTKHREEPAELSQKYFKDDRTAPDTLPNSHKNALQPFQVRPPLEIKTSNQQNINLRLKQLDSVNDKIKLILANKRQSSVNIGKSPIPVVSNNGDFQSTSKKMTSLFQNENKIVESKVGPSMNKFLSMRQKAIDPRSLRSNSIRNTVQSRLCTNQGNQLYRIKQDKYDKYHFQNYIDKKETKLQEKNLKTDCDFTDSYQNKFDTTFANHNRQSFQVQESTSQYYQKHMPSLKDPIIRDQMSISGFYGKDQTKKLVKLLSDQIILDKKLRDAKEQYDNLKMENKWSKLKDQLKTYCLQLTDEDYQTWLKLSPQESNPFSQKISNSNFSFQQLGNCFIDAWRHWNQKLKESVQIAKLEEQGFKIQQIDLGQKGYITIEDLVCFINLNSDGCLRNRDVFCFLKRLNPHSKSQKVENKLSYETFLNFVAQ